MKFNFQMFVLFAAKAYRQLETIEYTLDEVLSIFRCYFETYESAFKKPHPNIRVEQIKSIITAMPYLEDVHGEFSDITPECYPDMIECHFQTQYRNCDYNINHFFSGDIRMLRMYESCY